MSTFDYRSRYAKESEHNGIKLTLIGHWIDLAAYYRGSDGNAWSYQGRFTNCGPCDEFISRVQSGKVRGVIH